MPALLWILAALFCMVLEFIFSSFRYIWLAVAGLLTALGVKLSLLPKISSQLLFFIACAALLLLLIRPVALRSIKRRQNES